MCLNTARIMVGGHAACSVAAQCGGHQPEDDSSSSSSDSTWPHVMSCVAQEAGALSHTAAPPASWAMGSRGSKQRSMLASLCLSVCSSQQHGTAWMGTACKSAQQHSPRGFPLAPFKDCLESSLSSHLLQQNVAHKLANRHRLATLRARIELLHSKSWGENT